jgi:hypothetical protein
MKIRGSAITNFLKPLTEYRPGIGNWQGIGNKKTGSSQ